MTKTPSSLKLILLPLALSLVIPRGATAQAPPTVTTTSVTNITATGATFVGSVNPGGAGTFARFNWGITTNYGNSLPYQNCGSGNTNADVTAMLNSLTPGTVYHVQLEATNAFGPAFGPDEVFTTVGPLVLTIANPTSFSFQSQTNVYYLLQRSESLGDSNQWRTIDAQIGVGGMMTMTYQPHAPGSHEFFRVAASYTPPVYFGDLQAVRNSALVFTNGTSLSNKMYAIQQLNIGISQLSSNITLTPELQQSVAVWEALTDDQKRLLLEDPNNEYSLTSNNLTEWVEAGAAVVAAAAAVVSAAASLAETAIIIIIILAVQVRPMTSDELDSYINTYQTAPSSLTINVDPTTTEVKAADLDYGLRKTR